MPERDRMVCIGAIAGAHGVRGLVRIRSFTERPENVAAYGPVLDDRGRSYRIDLKGAAKGGVLAALEGVHNRDAAEALRGQRLYVPRAALPAADADEYYHADLVGLVALDEDGEALGEVVAVHEHGSAPVLEIRPERGESRLVPFTRDAVPSVDLAAGRLTVAALPGLLDG